MIITHKLTLDLQKKGELQRIDVVQGDAGTRVVELTLLSGSAPWEIPAQAQLAVRYLKMDGTSGIYDHLPDGTPDYAFDGNVIVLELAPQMLTCAGAVQVQVELSDQELRIATFAFLIAVEQAVAMDGETGDYVNWTRVYLPQLEGAVPGQYLRVANVDEAGRVMGLETAEVESSDDLEARLAFVESVLPDVADRVNDATHTADSALQAVENAVVAPEAAQVGQSIAVKEVDENGKPTLWEAVDLPAGGSGGDEWETIIDYTVPEDCVEVFLKTDLSGKPFQLKKAIVTFLLRPIDGVTASLPVRATVDGTIEGGVYGADHYAHGMPTMPATAGNYMMVRLEVISTPTGVLLMSLKHTQAETAYSEEGVLGIRSNSATYEGYNPVTLLAKVTEISAAGLGSYSTAIGAGSRIVMVGVRK